MSQASEAFWLLSDPFEARPDVRFLVPSKPIRAALAALQSNLERVGPNWILVLGPPGVGKSVLIQLFAEAWAGEHPLAFIPDASIPYGELGAQLSEQLDPEGRDEEDPSSPAPIIILEADRDLEPAVVGGLERDWQRDEGPSTRFIAVLDREAEGEIPDWAHQRRATVIPLKPLDAVEARAYVRRRIRLAAGGERDLFDEGAVDEIYRRTLGLPSLINQLAGQALERAASLGLPRVSTEEVVAEAHHLGDLNDAVSAALESESPVLEDMQPLEPVSLSPDQAYLAARAPRETSEEDADWEADVILEEESLAEDQKSYGLLFISWLVGLIMGLILAFLLTGPWQGL